MFKIKKSKILFVATIVIIILTWDFLTWGSLTSWIIDWHKTPYSKVVGEFNGNEYTDKTSKEWTEQYSKYENSQVYTIGVNEKGTPIFINPTKAIRQARKEFRDGFKAIEKEFKLLPVNRLNWSEYSTYGCQLTTGTDEEKEQALAISSFFDIYENSFKPYL